MPIINGCKPYNISYDEQDVLYALRKSDFIHTFKEYSFFTVCPSIKILMLDLFLRPQKVTYIHKKKPM